MNVDIKILTKLIANRIEKVIPDIIDESQLAYVRGKNINEGIRIIDYTIDYCEKTNGEGALVAIDFKKAFDSISHEYLLQVMSIIGFPETTLNVFNTLYNGAESAVMNNGLTTKYFPLEKGCRQGDSLSPYLFIIAIDPLIRMLKGKYGIKGINTPAGNLKITAYADDITIFARNEEDINKAFQIIQDFGKYSGLKMNKDKTEILVIGASKGVAFKNREIEKLKVKTLKVTGVHFGTSETKEQAERDNFEPILANIKRTLNEWNTRDLSILGRALVVKSQAIGQLQYMANSICIPNKIIKELKKVIYKFIWKGVDKIKRENAAKPIKEGGINLPMLDNVVAAAAVQWIRKRKCQPERPWAKFMDKDFKKIGGYSGFNSTRLEKDNKEENMAAFNIYLLEKWNEVTKGENINVRDFGVHKNRKFTYKVKKQTRMIESQYLMRKGYCTVNQFYDADGRIIEAEASCFKDDMIGKMEWTKVTKILASKIGKNIKKQISDQGNQEIQLYLMDDSIKVDISVLTQNKILRIIAKRKKYEANNFIKKQLKKEEDLIIYMDKFRLLWRSTKDTKTRSFFLRFLLGLTYANKHLQIFGYKTTSKCDFCDHPEQDRKHLFEECRHVKEIKATLRRKISDLTNVTEGHKTLVEFYLEMMCNHYIYKCNNNGKVPSIKGFVAQLGAVRQIEFDISIKNKTHQKYNMKWRSIDQVNL